MGMNTTAHPGPTGASVRKHLRAESAVRGGRHEPRLSCVGLVAIRDLSETRGTSLFVRGSTFGDRKLRLGTRSPRDAWRDPIDLTA